MIDHQRTIGLVDVRALDGLTNHVGDQGRGVMAKRPRLYRPGVVKDRGVDLIGFRRAGIDRCFPFKFPAFPDGWFAADRVDEPVEFHLDPRPDIRRAGRELGQHLLRYVSDFGDPVHRHVPADTQPGSQFGTQPGVVDRGEGALVLFDQSGV